MHMTFLNNGHYHSKGEKATFATTWMDPDGIMLNKSDRERHVLYIITCGIEQTQFTDSVWEETGRGERGSCWSTRTNFHL